MNETQLKERLQELLGSNVENQRAGEHILEAFKKMEADGLDPYMTGVNTVIACCALIHEEKNERLDDFMDFTIKAANKAKETNGK